MATLKLNTKTLATQTSSAEPVIASTVTGGAGLSGMTSLGTVTTGTLGSNVVFPSTHPDITIFRPDWSSSYSGTTATTVGAYQVWTNKRASSTVHVELTFHWVAYRDSGDKAFRAFYAQLYYSTSSVADGATSSLGTELARVTLGRRLEAVSSADMNSYGTATIQGAFTSGSAGTNYYIGASHHSINSGELSIFYGGGTGDSSGSQLKVIEV